MNTKQETEKEVLNSDLNAEVRARVPQWMADTVGALASSRVIAGKRLTGADIVREAIEEYLERHNAKRKAKAA